MLSISRIQAAKAWTADFSYYWWGSIDVYIGYFTDVQARTETFKCHTRSLSGSPELFGEKPYKGETVNGCLTSYPCNDYCSIVPLYPKSPFNYKWLIKTKDKPNGVKIHALVGETLVLPINNGKSTLSITPQSDGSVYVVEDTPSTGYHKEKLYSTKYHTFIGNLTDTRREFVSWSQILLDPNGIDNKIQNLDMLCTANTGISSCNARSKAIDGTKVIDMNSSQYLADLCQIGGLARQIVNIMRMKISPKNVIKGLSSGYLLEKYALESLARDTDMCMNAIMREYANRSVARGSATTSWNQRWSGGPDILWDTEYRCKINYTPCDSFLAACAGAWCSSKGETEMVRQLKTYGLYPDLAILWDYIPYSFVVDWFLPFGDALANLDRNSYIYTLPVLCSVESMCFKSTGPIEQHCGLTQWAGQRLVGQVEYTIYKRVIRDSLLPIPIGCGVEMDQKGPFLHFGEGAALLLQKIL